MDPTASADLIRFIELIVSRVFRFILELAHCLIILILCYLSLSMRTVELERVVNQTELIRQAKSLSLKELFGYLDCLVDQFCASGKNSFGSEQINFDPALGAIEKESSLSGLLSKILPQSQN